MNPKKILIVDDQARIRELVHVTIKFGKDEIFEAASRDEAVKVAMEQRPEMIILDVMMPNSTLDGFEVCEILKKDERTRNAHILMLTALASEENLTKGNEAGADGYFTKPFSPLALMNKVEEVLG